MEIMSEQENTSAQEIILSLKEEYQNRMIEMLQHFSELYDSREEDDDELKACATILHCGLTIGEIIENETEELEEKHLTALTKFLKCATSKLVYAGKTLKLMPGQEIREGDLESDPPKP